MTILSYSYIPSETLSWPAAIFVQYNMYIYEHPRDRCKFVSRMTPLRGDKKYRSILIQIIYETAPTADCFTTGIPD